MKALKLSALALAAVACGSASAALTLTTTGWQADAFQTFSVSGFGSATAAGITITGAGNTEQMPDATVTDPESGLQETVPVFRFPVTKTSVKLFTGGLLAKPVSGDSSRSALKFSRGTTKAAGIANMSINFEQKILYSDIILPTGTSKAAPTFTFTDNGDTVVKISGFAINMKGSIQDLVFTTQAADGLASALALSGPLKATLATQNWGRVDIAVSSKSRSPKTNATPLTAAEMGITQTAP